MNQLAVDLVEGKIYFGSIAVIRRADLDGSHVEDAATGIVFDKRTPRTIAVDTTSPDLQAGDSDRDYDFDVYDIVQVQLANRYLTGQPADWAQGDWNGAPDGSQSMPPEGDGVFNQLDIVAALNAGRYLTGPYAAVTVPEPATAILAVLGFIFLSVERIRRSLAAFAFVVLLSLPAITRADFTAVGNEHMEVNSAHSVGTLYDSSTANILSGGTVAQLQLHNNSSLRISGGEITQMESHGTSSVDMLSGRVTDVFNAWDNSAVEIHGGIVYELNAFNDSVVEILDGDVSHLRAQEFSRVTIHGSNFSVTGAIGNMRLENGKVIAENAYLSYDQEDGTHCDTVIASNPSTAVIWTAAPIAPHELSAGDANQDYVFDQADILRVLFPSPKYLTGEPATWGEGDWDGAPGGRPGNPPPGDGVFNQKDIVAALSAGKYLTGPYAAVPVPEPAAIVSALAGLVCLTAVARRSV